MIECPKCKEAIEPYGNHEEDAGEHECDDCGFKFIVEIDYEPSYSERCVEHKFGEFKTVKDRCGCNCVARYCEYCGSCELKQE